MSFGNDFVWGAATASYQIEGAAYEDGKSLSIWDVFSHTEGKIRDNSSGDTACDHYHRYKEDVRLMAELGLKAYRFSFSWNRILPDDGDKINPKGIAFYHALLDELEKYNIEPYATLYHWDLPYALHKKGGWLNDNISDRFEHYARVIAEHFGNRIKHFITINEPQVITGCGYQTGEHAPGYHLANKELLQIGHNILKAHGKATKILKEMIPDVKVGFTIASTVTVPVSDEDIEATKNTYFSSGKDNFVYADAYWMDPIVFGKYPDSILNECADILPEITKEDMEIISTPIDFLGLNIYFGLLKKASANGTTENVEWPVGQARTAIRWNLLPEAMYWGTRFHYERYHLPIYITENGMSAHDWVSLDGKVHDPNRIDFTHRYLRELKRSKKDGTDIRGYFHWSLMDNYEWSNGYTDRFGIIFVDYNTGERIIKDSGYWYRDVIASNGESI